MHACIPCMPLLFVPYPLLRYLQVEHVRRVEIPQEGRVVQPPSLCDGLGVTTKLLVRVPRRKEGNKDRGREGGGG